MTELRIPLWFLTCVIGCCCSVVAAEEAAVSSSAAAKIGKRIFLDTSLSRPPGQGCVSCHQPAAAFADPRPVSPGAVDGREGKRNSPSLMYAGLIPGFAYDEFFTKDGAEVYAWEDAFTDRTLLKMKPGQMFPAVPTGTPSTQDKRLYFPDWTHRMHVAFPGVADAGE